MFLYFPNDLTNINYIKIKLMVFNYRMMRIERRVPVRVLWSLQVATVVKQQYLTQLQMKVNIMLIFFKLIR